jgi:two-component system response regulator TctD
MAPRSALQPVAPMRLLLVEDSLKLAAWLCKALKQHGYAVDVSHDGAQADSMLSTEHYDAIVLDLSLPSMDGLTVLERLRARGNASPVVILTARGELEDRVRGLNLGADDYLPKPFDLAELEARLQAVLRRAHGQPVSRLSLGALDYDGSGRVFTLGGQRLVLRPKEHAVLEALMLRAGKAVSKAKLYEQVFSLDATTSQDVVEIYIHRLRKQLLDSGVQITTLRGLGYVLEAV